MGTLMEILRHPYMVEKTREIEGLEFEYAESGYYYGNNYLDMVQICHIEYS